MRLQGDALEAFAKLFGIGGIGLAALWIVMRSRFWKNGQNGHSGIATTEGAIPSGQLTVGEWELKVRKLHEEYNEALMADMRQLLEARLTKAVSDGIRDALTPLPGEIAEALRKVFREKNL